MYTSIGELLKAKRRERRLGVDQICNATGVPFSVVGWIEECNYQSIGSRLYFTRYVKAYAEFLGVDYASISADCEREWELHTFREARKEKHPIPSYVSRLTLRYGFIGSIVSIVLLIGVYFSYQVLYLVGAPVIKISEPSSERTVTSSPFITVSGRSFNDAKVSVNQRPVSISGQNFKERLYLNPGLNTISVTAVNLRGAAAHEVRYVVYKP